MAKIHVEPQFIGKRPQKHVVEEMYPGKFVVISGHGYDVYDSREEWCLVKGHELYHDEGGNLIDLLGKIARSWPGGANE